MRILYSENRSLQKSPIHPQSGHTVITSLDDVLVCLGYQQFIFFPLTTVGHIHSITHQITINSLTHSSFRVTADMSKNKNKSIFSQVHSWYVKKTPSHFFLRATLGMSIKHQTSPVCPKAC